MANSTAFTNGTAVSSSRSTSTENLYFFFFIMKAISLRPRHFTLTATRGYYVGIKWETGRTSAILQLLFLLENPRRFLAENVVHGTRGRDTRAKRKLCTKCDHLTLALSRGAATISRASAIIFTNYSFYQNISKLFFSILLKRKIKKKKKKAVPRSSPLFFSRFLLSLLSNRQTIFFYIYI